MPILKATYGSLPIDDSKSAALAMPNVPVIFGHRGARGHAQENTVEAFDLALKLGATGLETDAWITRDGHVVLDHDGQVGSRFRRRPIRDVDAQDLPTHVPHLAEFCRRYSEVHLSIDVKDVNAFETLCRTLDATDCDPNRVWICHPDLEVLASWTKQSRFHLVHSTRYGKISPRFESHAAELSHLGIGALNMPATEWSGGLIALFHRFSVKCFAWNVQYAEVARPLIAAGIDAIYGDYVDRLVDAARA